MRATRVWGFGVGVGSKVLGLYDLGYSTVFHNKDQER